MAADRSSLRGLAFFAAVLALTTGCAGARTNVVADGAAYPVSLSAAVRDADGDIVEGERVTKIATFKSAQTAVGLMYSGANVHKKIDLSQQINAQVAKAGGDAIVNLKVKSNTCALDWVPFAAAVPLWPGCADIQVEGDIIKVRRKAVVVRVGSGGTRIALLEALR